MDLLDVIVAITSDESSTVDLSNLSLQSQRHAMKSGLGAYLSHSADRGQLKVSPALMEALRSADLTSQILTGEYLDALEEILHELQPLTHEVTLLKGISICQSHYPVPHLRPMGDIDLLVPDALHPGTEMTLQRLGYRQTSSNPEEYYRNHHHSMPFYHSGRGVWVEIHRSLFQQSARVARDPVFSSKGIQQQRVNHRFRGLDCYRLSDELQLIYTCAHWAEEFNTSRGLLPLADMCLLLKNKLHPLRWEVLLSWAQNSASSKYLAFLLLYLQRRRLIELPGQVHRALANASTNMNTLSRLALTRALERFVLQGQSTDSGFTRANAEILWATLMKPGSPWLNLSQLPWNLLFPPGHPHRYSPALLGRRLRSAFKAKSCG